jgi:hypothetical protein
MESSVTVDTHQVGFLLQLQHDAAVGASESGKVTIDSSVNVETSENSVFFHILC